MASLELVALDGFPLVEPGDDLVALVVSTLSRMGKELRDGDTLAFAQKVVSKSQDRYLDLETVTPSAEAVRLAEEVDKDPRLVEEILSESTEVVAQRPGVLVVAHRLGLVLANAGIDHSNIEQPPNAPADSDQRVLLLPVDPDGTSVEMRRSFAERFGVDIAVLITDSPGRAWRQGTVGIAIGAAGLVSLSDQRGDSDLFGRELRVTEVGHADELAAAASIVMGQGAEGRPVVLIRGHRLPGRARPAADLVRPKDQDLFR